MMSETAQDSAVRAPDETAPAQHAAVPALTAMRTFVIIWIGQVVSIVGSSLTHFGLGVWIFQQTGDAMPFALTVLFGSLP